MLKNRFDSKGRYGIASESTNEAEARVGRYHVSKGNSNGRLFMAIGINFSRSFNGAHAALCSRINWAFRNNRWHRLPAEKFITNVPAVSTFTVTRVYIVFRARGRQPVPRATRSFLIVIHTRTDHGILRAWAIYTVIPRPSSVAEIDHTNRRYSPWMNVPAGSRCDES